MDEAWFIGAVLVGCDSFKKELIVSNCLVTFVPLLFKQV